MTNYHFDELGAVEFQKLCQSLVQKIIGSGAKVYGEGREGGRDASFEGKALYPSEAEQWDGFWRFQAKFHNVQLIGTTKARSNILQDMKTELGKIIENGYPCDNFILMTNVPLSGVPGSGTRDKIDKKIKPEFKDKIKHIDYWGYEEICRFLDTYPEIQQTYFPRDSEILREGMDKLSEAQVKSKQERLAELQIKELIQKKTMEHYSDLDQYVFMPLSKLVASAPHHSIVINGRSLWREFKLEVSTNQHYLKEILDSDCYPDAMEHVKLDYPDQDLENDIKNLREDMETLNSNVDDLKENVERTIEDKLSQHARVEKGAHRHQAQYLYLL